MKSRFGVPRSLRFFRKGRVLAPVCDLTFVRMATIVDPQPPRRYPPFAKTGKERSTRHERIRFTSVFSLRIVIPTGASHPRRG
jgi:hypothetical protein